MKYILIFFLFLSIQNISLAQLDSFPSENTPGLRYNVLDKPWAIHLDLTRLTYQASSIQLSTSYRHNFRFGFESEFNYYLNSKITKETTRLDALQIGTSSKKPSLFISGIGKIYFGDKKIQYLAARLVIGSINIDLSRNVCTVAQPSTSGEICQCLQMEDRSLTVHKRQFIYGLRYGIDLPLTNRIRFNTFVDFAANRYTKPNYQHLEHACDPAWPHFKKVPKTDGLFTEYKEWSNELYFSLGVKLGYAF